ncbi:MAG TPA: ABC transporter ATP-binding protein [Fimbriimonadaceae bacterium]
MSDFLLSCKSLACGYRGRQVLHDINFDLAPGDVVALLGPNGSGKSTLLRTLIRSLAAQSGSVTVQGISIEKMDFKTLAGKVAFVPQDEYAAYPFTVREVVMMGRLPISSGLFDSKEDAAAAEEAMAQADCWDLRGRSILELSGGERQRVWIARALAQSAPVLLLDEPSSHLDVAHQVTLVKLLRNLSEKGLAILAAVHDLNLAATLAPRAILISEGTIGMDSSTEDVLNSLILEKVYGVEFERLPGARTRVFPK